MSKTHCLHTNRNGTLSIKHIASGEVMHSSIGPEQEAKLLYIEQSNLEERLKSPSVDPLIIYDIGLGAGSNALASLTCLNNLKNNAKRKLEIHSFENDLSGIKLAFENKNELPFFTGFEKNVQELITNHKTTNEDFFWKLHAGDFLENLSNAPKPDLVFFDFYSPKVSKELWTIDLFSKLFKHCSPKSHELFTYSASTKVRAALLLAGYFVGYGQSTGAKCDTTCASTEFKNLTSPLDERWLLRLSRSHESCPLDWTYGESDLYKKISEHPQFTSFLK